MVILEHDEASLEVDEVVGTFNELERAKTLIADLHLDLGVGVQHFCIERWNGRRFEGAYNHEGKLIEKSDGREVKPQ